MTTELTSQPKTVLEKKITPQGLFLWLVLVPFILLLFLGCGLVSLWGMRPLSGGRVASNLEVDYAPWNQVAFQPLSTNIVAEILQDLQDYAVEAPLPAVYLRNPLPSSTPSPAPTSIPSSTYTAVDQPTHVPPSDTATLAATQTPALTATSTFAAQVLPSATCTDQPPPPASDTLPPPQDTATQAPANTPTHTATNILVSSSTPTATQRPSSTPTPSITPPPTIPATATPTATHTPTATATSTATPAPMVFPTPGGGDVHCNSPITIDLGADVYVRYFVYHESLRASLLNDCGFPGSPDVPGICMDWVWVDASLDSGLWTNYFFWGDADGGNNGSLINPEAPNEFDNQPIPASQLVSGSGIVIPVYEVIHYVRIGTSDCPGAGGDEDAAQVSDFYIYP